MGMTLTGGFPLHPVDTIRAWEHGYSGESELETRLELATGRFRAIRQPTFQLTIAVFAQLLSR